MVLTEIGYSVRSAQDGFSALVEIRKDVPDIILSDLNMPGMSGFELLSVVRRRFPSIRVIAMSGAFSGDEMPSGVDADAFYPKGRRSLENWPSRSGCLHRNQPPRLLSGLNETDTIPPVSLMFRSTARSACGPSRKPLAVFLARYEILSARYEKRLAYIAEILFTTRLSRRATAHPNKRPKNLIARQNLPVSPNCSTEKQGGGAPMPNISERNLLLRARVEVPAGLKSAR
jgi:CheY-like chemotaxis protein